MIALFYVSAAVAVIATLLVITRLNPVHALLYMVVSLLSVSLVFWSLGAPFVAALEVIVYAGAIMVLFVFVIMMLNLGAPTVAQERRWLSPGMWIGPSLLCLVLFVQLVLTFRARADILTSGAMVSPEQVGGALFGPYLVAVELAAMLLLAGLVSAYHLGRRDKPAPEKESAPR